MTDIDGVTIAIDADTSAFQREIEDADRLARGLGSSLTKAFDAAMVRGQDFGDVLRSLALRLSSLAVSSAFKPIEQGLGSLFQGLFSGATGFAKGGVLDGIARTVPFAAGGVVASPTYFPMSSSTLGLMGERGAEAILPLSRGADGRLGVRSDGGAAPRTIHIQVATPDAASFKRSEAYLSNMIARAVSRGERNA
jgi:phage-related minor tail protein